MKLTYTLTQEEFLDAMKIHHDSKRVLLWTVLGTLLAIYFVLSTNFSNITSILTQLGVIVVASVLYMFLRGLMHRYAHTNYYKTNPSISSEMSLTTDEENLNIQRNEDKVSISWDDISKWGFDEDFYLIYTSISAFHVIPTRVMSDADKKELESHLEGKFKMLHEG